jgi:hypothetical protein
MNEDGLERNRRGRKRIGRRRKERKIEQKKSIVCNNSICIIIV